MKTEIEAAIKHHAEQATKAELESHEALHLSQAVLNLAHARNVLKETDKT